MMEGGTIPSEAREVHSRGLAKYAGLVPLYPSTTVPPNHRIGFRGQLICIPRPQPGFGPAQTSLV